MYYEIFLKIITDITLLPKATFFASNGLSLNMDGPYYCSYIHDMDITYPLACSIIRWAQQLSKYINTQWYNTHLHILLYYNHII